MFSLKNFEITIEVEIEESKGLKQEYISLNDVMLRCYVMPPKVR